MSSEEGNDDDDDDKDEAASSSSQWQQQRSQGISERDFRQLLVDIAKWYDGLGYLKMLKVLYRDHVNDNCKLNEATKMMELLNYLIGSGNLSSTNLTIMYDTVKLTGQSGFKSKIRNQLPLFQNVEEHVVSTFTQHRQKLLKLGAALRHKDIETLDAIYNIPLSKKYEDSWSLIMDLEDKGELGEGNMDKFIEVLQSNEMRLAEKSLLDGDEMEPQVLQRPQLVLPSGQDSGDKPAAKRQKLCQSSNQGEKGHNLSSWSMLSSKDDSTSTGTDDGVPSTSHHQQPSQDDVIRKYLINQQTKLCRNANRFTPGTLNTRYQVDIAHMFTDLDLLKGNRKKKDAKPTTLEEVLDIIKLTPACKVLINGEGGIGKTTLLRYLAYNWATKESDETFQGKIVFLLNIRDIDKDEDILDVILKEMKLKDFNSTTNLTEDPKLIKRFIMNHDDEIVLMLDGLDELRDKNKSPINLFKKEELENSTVILTSRPEKIDEFINESTVHVKVKGFNADNIRTYINKYFEHFEVPELGHSLIKVLKLDGYEWERGGKHEEVYSMCKNPMLLLSICIMWEEGQHLPADKADLFNEVFRCILNQFIDKQEGEEQKITEFENAPEKYVNAMLLLGKCMFEGLQRNQLSLNKRDLEGKEETVVLALKLGFVYKDAPNLKANFEEIFTSPHKLIVESLVGFYLYKLCQTEGLQIQCTEDMDKLLKPLDDNAWEIIRESKHLNTAKQFAIEFLGADAGKFLKHLLTNSFSTYRSLMTYLKFVKKEHIIAVEKTLIDHKTKKDKKIKHHTDKICKSLTRFIQNINPDVELDEGEHLVQLIRRVHDIRPLPMSYNDAKTMIERFLKAKSSKEKGRILAHILIAVPYQQHFLEGINEVCTDDDDDDDVVKYLQAECKKLNFKYDITKYILENTSITASYLLHLLSNTQLITLELNCSITAVTLNVMIRECSSTGIMLELEQLDISNNDLSNIDGSSLACLFVIAPKLRYLYMQQCSLSGVTINDMIRECFRKGGVKLELQHLIISGNDLSNIDGSSLACLFVIAPKLYDLNMKECSLSGVTINDMTRECFRKGVKLELKQLVISLNDLSNIDGSSLSCLFVIAPKLHYLYMPQCSLSSVTINDMIRECFRKGVKLELQNLNISNNDLSNIDGSSLACLFVIAPKLCYLNMPQCSLSSVTINDMIRECFRKGVKLELQNLNISNNDLSNIDGSSLACLFVIAPKLLYLYMPQCSLSGVTMKDMARECFRKGEKLELQELYISGNDLSNIDGSSLSCLFVIAPKLCGLEMRQCSLSGVTINDMIRECFRKGVKLELHYLNISNNDLSNIDGSTLRCLLDIPQLWHIWVSNCSLSNAFMNDMRKQCSSNAIYISF